MDSEKTIDFSYRRSPLAVRQTLAVAFCIPLDRELTWDYLRMCICDPSNIELPTKIVLRGLAGMRLPDEERELSALFRALQVVRPDIRVSVVLLE